MSVSANQTKVEPTSWIKNLFSEMNWYKPERFSEIAIIKILTTTAAAEVASDVMADLNPLKNNTARKIPMATIVRKIKASCGTPQWTIIFINSIFFHSLFKRSARHAVWREIFLIASPIIAYNMQNVKYT